MLKKFEDFVDILRQCESTCEKIAVVEHPFSVECMDASHDFTSCVITEVRKYCELEFGIYVERVLLVACFLSENTPEPQTVKFDSNVKLMVLKGKDGKHLAFLFLGAEIFRK